ncbi:CTAG/Pcc1 family [Dipodascopsis tothii]|uniref:CTAG/Pcc1 family n=1 Tax=Dipodascopsis tothii TaxID=44089 RepID=UPI0034CD1CEC
MDLPTSLSLQVPFPTARQAQIAYGAISPDPQVKPDQFVVDLVVEDSTLNAKFSAASDRVLRVGVNGFFESLNVVLECLHELDVQS